MKKIIAFTMSLLMIFSLCACGTTYEPMTESPETSTIESKTETFTSIEVVNDENVSFIIKERPNMGSFWGAEIPVFLDNKTDKDLMYSLDKVSVNGFMVNCLFATELSSGKKENTSITIFSEDLESNGIKTITDISFTLRIYDTNNWDAKSLVEEKFDINF